MEVDPHIRPALGTCKLLHRSQLCEKHVLLVVTRAPQNLSLLMLLHGHQCQLTASVQEAVLLMVLSFFPSLRCHQDQV